MKWFKHDTDTSEDPKIKLLKRKYKATGCWVYFEINRLIAKNVKDDNISEWGYLQKEYTDFPELLAEEVCTDSVQKLNEIVTYCVQLQLLYKCDARILNPKVLSRADRYTEDKAKKLQIKLDEYVQSLYRLCTESSPRREENRREENRREEKSEDENKNPHTSLDGLIENDFLEISQKYNVPITFVKSKYDDMVNWHEKNPRKNHYSNYHRALMDWVKRDAVKLINETRKENQYAESKRGVNGTAQVEELKRRINEQRTEEPGLGDGKMACSNW